MEQVRNRIENHARVDMEPEVIDYTLTVTVILMEFSSEPVKVLKRHLT